MTTTTIAAALSGAKSRVCVAAAVLWELARQVWRYALCTCSCCCCCCCFWTRPARDDHSQLQPVEREEDEESPPVRQCSCGTKNKTDDPGEVQVYILLGQSNMLGMGAVGVKGDIKEGTLDYAVRQKGLYPYLLDKHTDNNREDSAWATSKTIRNVRVMSNGSEMNVFHNEWMTIRNGDKIGPEFGMAHHLQAPLQAQTPNGCCRCCHGNNNKTRPPVMLLKSCIGNRSLGWDLLPPGSQQYEYEGDVYAGYKDSPASWKKGSHPQPIDWYAGKQYDDDVLHAKMVLQDLDTYYPGSTKYRIAGFFWWQGDKDRYSEAYSVVYEKNLVQLIHQLRVAFAAPRAKFVLATLGQSDLDNCKGNEGKILDAMMAVDGTSGKYPQHVGNVTTVYTHHFSKGGASNSHYNGNAETYMNVGQAMGRAMAKLVRREN